MKKNKVSELMGLIPEYLRDRSVPVWLKECDVLLWEGEETKFVYVLLAGKLHVVRTLNGHTDYSFGYMSPGRYVCDMEVIAERLTNAATLIATEASLLLRFEMKDFTYCLDNDIQFMRMIVKGLVGPLVDNVFDCNILAASSREEKLVNLLLDYYSKKCTAAKSDCVPIAITRDKMAFELNVSVKTVNRAVKCLLDQGFLSIHRRRIYISKQQAAALMELISKKRREDEEE